MQYTMQEVLARACDTKFCLIEQGAVTRTGEIFAQAFPNQKALLVADENTWEVAGKAAQASLCATSIEQDAPFIFSAQHFYAEWQFIEQLEAHVQPKDVIIIAVGSGVINDLCKLVSGRLGRRYMCVGTAASMDGFTAYGASITKDGNKQTFSCPAPYAFVMDYAIAAKAPKELAASGYADLIAKIPAGADWLIADRLGVEAVDDFAWHLLQDNLRESLNAPAAVFQGDLEKTKALCEGLLMSGFAMQAIHSSRPASGTEHQFSHFWDMEALSYPDSTHVSHGFKVGIGTLVSTAALEFLLEKGVAVDAKTAADKWPTWEEMEGHIQHLCAGKPGHLTRCLEESKANYVTKEQLEARILLLQEKWPVLREEIREQILPFRQVYDSLKAVGAPYEPEQICVSRAHLKETLSFIPYMRSRFTAIDLLLYLGYMDEFSQRLFGKGGIWSRE